MNGTAVPSTGTVGNVPTNWTVQSATPSEGIEGLVPLGELFGLASADAILTAVGHNLRPHPRLVEGLC
jgi:hypothetical protein